MGSRDARNGRVASVSAFACPTLCATAQAPARNGCQTVDAYAASRIDARSVRRSAGRIGPPLCPSERRGRDREPPAGGSWRCGRARNTRVRGQQRCLLGSSPDLATEKASVNPGPSRRPAREVPLARPLRGECERRARPVPEGARRPGGGVARRQGADPAAGRDQATISGRTSVGSSSRQRTCSQTSASSSSGAPGGCVRRAPPTWRRLSFGLVPWALAANRHTRKDLLLSPFPTASTRG